jgi:hypothetical protein
MIRLYVVLSAVAILAVTGYFLLGQKDDAGRGIASVETEGGNQLRDLKMQMLKKMTIDLVGDDALISIGAFDGICEKYPKIEVLLRAEGIAVDGEAPTIKVTRTCEHAMGSEVLEAVVVPVGYINQLEADDQSFKDERGQLIEIKNGAGVWPPEWHVFNVHLSNPSSGEVLDADSYEIAFVHGAPLIVNF